MSTSVFEANGLGVTSFAAPGGPRLQFDTAGRWAVLDAVETEKLVEALREWLRFRKPRTPTEDTCDVKPSDISMKMFGTFGTAVQVERAKFHGMMPVHGDARGALLAKGVTAPAGVPIGPFMSFEKRVNCNHHQGAEELAARGGLSPAEMLAILQDEGIERAASYDADEAAAMREVLDWFYGWGWTPWTLDDALAGEKEAIEEQFRQMIGALHKVNTLTPDGCGFVERRTLQGLARLACHEIDQEGRVKRPGSSDPWEPVGQGIMACVSRSVAHPFAPTNESASDQKYADRAQVTLRRGLPGDGGTSLYIAPPALALREWASVFGPNDLRA